jgi:pyruvate ferredoxin oxidoreductase beta subunit
VESEFAAMPVAIEASAAGARAYKATRAMDFRGARYLHILVPCPLGWSSSPADTVKVVRLGTESGLFPVFEAEAGQVTSSTPIRHQVPVTDYLRIQARYAHLFKPEKTEFIGRIQAAADRNIPRFGLARPRVVRDLFIIPPPNIHRLGRSSTFRGA